jgi:hypothetical protein
MTMPSPPMRSPNDVGVAPVAFTPAPDYTTFRAEFALEGGDIIVHFFLPGDPDARAGAPTYWTETFPAELERVAKEVFKADYPRLQAQHVSAQDLGIDSWWLRAFGFGHLLDPAALTLRFFERLDVALDAVSCT